MSPPQTSQAEPGYALGGSPSLKLAGHVAQGDVGAMRRFLHGLRLWVVDPWRLIEHTTAPAIRSETAAAPGNDRELQRPARL